MSHVINVSVKNKIAEQTDHTVYVCGNSDFTIKFDFDDEWEQYDAKTARFIYGDTYADVVFRGDTCAVPIITNTYNIKVGVFAGDLSTTTPAHISAKKSILCGTGIPVAPTDDVYNQIMDMLKDIQGVDPDEVADIVNKYMEEHPIEESDPTVPEWAKADTKPTYTADEVGAIAKVELQSAINGALAQAKASGEFDGAQGPKGDTGATGPQGEKGDKGDKGDNGVNGADGYTPVKGTDYWTASDKAEIVNDVLEALPTWTGGSY